MSTKRTNLHLGESQQEELALHPTSYIPTASFTTPSFVLVEYTVWAITGRGDEIIHKGYVHAPEGERLRVNTSVKLNCHIGTVLHGLRIDNNYGSSYSLVRDRAVPVLIFADNAIKIDIHNDNFSVERIDL